MDGRYLLLIVLFWAPAASADTIALKGHREPVQGEIVDETDDTFVIEVPKAQVTRVERSAPFTKRSTATASKVVWEERDGYLILQIPQQHLERRSGTAEATPSSLGARLIPPETEGSSRVAVNALAPPPRQVDQRLGGITGRVLWDGKPLANCKVKTVMVSSPQPPGMVSKLLGRSEAYAEEEGYVAEAMTNTSGRYRVERVPPGEYDLYWQPDGSPPMQWIRRLRDKPDLVVLDGEVATYADIEAHVRTRN